MKEIDVINALKNDNEEYAKIEEEHKQLGQTLDEILKKKYLSADEEVEKKTIQKQKLQLKDRMAQLIREYK